MYTYPDNFRAFKVLIAAQYSGANVKVQENFVFGETNTAKDFLAKFPTGKVSTILYAIKLGRGYYSIDNYLQYPLIPQYLHYIFFLRFLLLKPLMVHV